ncbi:MAG: alpha/beta hydrolase [Desulfosoma sp.]
MAFKRSGENSPTSFRGGSLLDLRPAGGDPQSISFSSQGLKIAADLYEAARNGPCILLLHGTHELGRKQPVMLALAANFHKLGYTVLALDFRGYNDSEDPPTVLSLKDLDFAQDAISGLDYLTRHASVNPSKIFIVGHSFGAGVALEVIQRDARAAKLVLIGPPRRVQQKILDPSAPTRDYLLTRFARHMRLASIPPVALCEQSIRKRDISTYLEDLNARPHIPILLIDGSEEEPADRLFLEDVYQNLSPPKTYWTVPHSDHYLNTDSIFGHAVYSRRILEPVVLNIDLWLKDGNDSFHFN